MIFKSKGRNFQVSIRTRFFILLLMMTFLPFLAYLLATDLHKVLLKNQTTIQYQTVVNLSLVLENRADLWALQIQSGKPSGQLAHLNLDESVLWVVNVYQQTTYVMGRFPEEENQETDLFIFLGEGIIKTFTTFLPFSFPYPFPQSKEPEKTLIEHSLQGETFQQYRKSPEGTPISLMSSAPLKINNRILGVIILEQKMSTLLGEPLNTFYRLVGISSLVFLFTVLAAVTYIASLSRRIVRLDADVRNTLSLKNKASIQKFPNHYQNEYHDEISDLRQHIFEMLQQISSYERYLKQFPKALRHELHNPLNRLTMSLSLLEEDINHKQLDFAQHAVQQLKQIISSLTEATSIEDSLSQQKPEKFPISIMLNNYMENVTSLNPEVELKFNINLPKSTQIMGDGFMLEQLMDKLLSNAKDFNDQKYPINVSAIIDKDDVIISVINTGKHLPKGFEKRIFDGMTSIRNPNESEQTHLGLGLYIVKLIVEYHNGTINAFNRDNINNSLQGVEFKVKLPIDT